MLTVLAIAVSIMLLLGVEKVRTGARQSFADTISGTDLIVGARSGSLQLAALFRLPHRQRHQQHHLGELPGHRRAARRSPGSCRCRSATAIAASACSAPRPTTSRTTSTARRTRLHFAAGRAVRRSVRRRDRRRRGGGARLQGRRPDRRRARARRRLLRRARRQAVPRRRHPGQDRHAGRPHGAREPGGHRGHPRRLAERGAHSRAVRVGRRGARDGPASRRRSRRR